MGGHELPPAPYPAIPFHKNGSLSFVDTVCPK